MQLIPDDLRATLEAHLASRTRGLLAARHDAVAARQDAPVTPREALADIDSGFRTALIDFVLDDQGKRIRPQLTLWATRQLGGDVTPAVLDAASGWEVFHAFLLVHDDIIDAAGERRRRPSLHRRLASLDGDAEAFGVNLGIVAGDLLFAAATRLWHLAAGRDGVEGRRGLAMLEVTSRIAMETGAGQAADIAAEHLPLEGLSERQVLAGYGGKTAAYTFEGPMLTGALLAGLDGRACGCLSRFGVALGQAYQVHNDWLDLAAEPRPGCDLLQGKRTVTLVRCFAGLDAGGRRQVTRSLAAASDPRRPAEDRLADAAELRRQLLAADAQGRTLALCGELLDRARFAATDEAVPPALSDGLVALLDTLRDRYFGGDVEAAEPRSRQVPAAGVVYP